MAFEASGDVEPAFREDWLLFAAAYDEHTGIGDIKIAIVA